MRTARQLPDGQTLAHNAAFGYGAEIGRQRTCGITVCPAEVQTAWGKAFGLDGPPDGDQTCLENREQQKYVGE